MDKDSNFFQKEKHISYWLRCLRTPLPHQYTSNDANRMSLTFFTLSALDLLGALSQRTAEAERHEYADWIYGCQHPDGGFRAFPGTDLGHKRNAENAVWDPAHVPATYFALASLAILRDDLSRVKRGPCLRWLRKMQRPGGSFGETLSENGQIEGGFDTRFGYCATAVRWILRGNIEGPVDGAQDIDVSALVRYIRGCESYDFGISQGPFHEAHAGLTYCAIGASSFLDRLPRQEPSLHDRTHEHFEEDSSRLTGLSSVSLTMKWLLSRLTTDIEDEDSDDEGFHDSAGEETGSQQTPQSSQSFQKFSSRPLSDTAHSSHASSHPEGVATSVDISAVHWVGCNGRSNKLADTCYVFWVAASLAMLDSLHLAPIPLVRNYLLERTQHLVMGGFGKLPGSLPDLYHAFLGLAALSLLNEQSDPDSELELEVLVPALCFSVKAKTWIESLPWRTNNVEPG